MHVRALSKYRSAYVESAPPVCVLDELLSKAIECLEASRMLVANGQYAEKAKRVDRALAIISELSLALDNSVAPELTANLARLYDFAASKTLAGSTSLDPADFQAAASVLTTIRDAFREVRQKGLIP